MIISCSDRCANTDRYLFGDPINPDGVTNINLPQGGIDDPTAKIWPFKIHRARQPYDVIYNYLLQPKTVGAGGYWETFDWDQALRLGLEATGLAYSGQYGFASTEMYWPQTHMVVPAERALQCTDCHGENTRMDWQALGSPGDPLAQFVRFGFRALADASAARPSSHRVWNVLPSASFCFFHE